MPRVLKGKASISRAGLEKQHHVNFVHTGEYAGNSLNHCSVFSNSWILDTGDTSHLCCDESSFQSLSPLVHPISLFLPDGSNKLVHLAGNVIVIPSLTLYNNLFAPT